MHPKLLPGLQEYTGIDAGHLKLMKDGQLSRLSAGMQQCVGTSAGQPSMFHASKPGAGVQEYTGIDAGRLELMEERLAEDVRREAVKHGRVLVAREVLSSAEQSSATIQDSHEVLRGESL